MSTTPESIIRDVFHISGFRDSQKEVIDHLLNHRDTLAVLPTGSGKSLTFQVPALVHEGLTLVVTPLISLMKDQVRRLRDDLGVMSCDYMASTRDRTENDSVLDRLEIIRLLYITPERLESKSFRETLQIKGIKPWLLVVDEAHCIHLWGKTFRPSYRNIGKFIALYPELTIAAFTATASAPVVQDIQSVLSMQTPAIIQKSAHRNNLNLSVLFVEDKMKALIESVKAQATTIIYNSSRAKCEEIAYNLTTNGIPAAFYHAGLDKTVRDKTQNDFMKGVTKVIVATSAFGMGIDKNDVRQIFHYQMPLELEEYIQEIGRAGRDGFMSECTTLVELKDYIDQEKLLKATYPDWKGVKTLCKRAISDNYARERLELLLDKSGMESAETLIKHKKDYLAMRRAAFEQFKTLKRFLSGSYCRTKFLLEHLGEKPLPCGHCDYCLNENDLFHMSSSETEVLSILAALGKSKKWTSIEALRQIVIGYHESGRVYPGFGVLKGLSMKKYTAVLLSMKNRGLLELNEKADAIRVNPSFSF